MMRLTLLMLSSLAIMSAAAGVKKDGTPATGKLVNAAPAPAGLYPWMVSLLQQYQGGPGIIVAPSGQPDFRNYAPYCGGSLIGRKWVLTAAHCGETGERVWALVGGATNISSTWILAQPASSCLSVRSGTFRRHPSYDEVQVDVYDFALIELDEAIPESCDHHIIKLNGDGMDPVAPLAGTQAFLSGFGSLFSAGGSSIWKCPWAGRPGRYCYPYKWRDAVNKPPNDAYGMGSGCESATCFLSNEYDPSIPTNNGFDATAPNYDSTPQVLLHLPQGFTVQSDDYCASSQAGGAAADFDPHSMICTTGVTPNTGDCQGDSGGPLIVRPSGGPAIQVGVVSFGIGCAQPGEANFYGDVAKVVNYIKHVIGTDPACPAWCNEYTCGMTTCSGCVAPTCGDRTPTMPAKCQFWCNSWTCPAPSQPASFQTFFATQCGECQICA